jgi:thiol-disulfide isomerase/thioredoxin
VKEISSTGEGGTIPNMHPKRNGFATLFGFAVVAAVVLGACSGVVQPEPVGSQTEAVSPDLVVSQSQLPADFQVVAYQRQDVLGGEEVQFSDLLGQGRPVVLNLWAGLCPPCRLEMPDFEAVNEQLGDQVLFIGLDVGPFTNLGTQEDGQALVRELGITYPIGTTSDADVVKDYELIGMPTTYFISPTGEVVQQWTGLLTEDKLVELVEELIQASADS